MPRIASLIVLLCAGLLAGCTSVHPEAAADEKGSFELPAEVAINPEAGRGGFLIVTLRLESGQEVPMIVDTGTTGTLFDKSLEPKLGKSIGKELGQSWGVIHTNNAYAMPKLYLGNTQLKPGAPVVTFNFKNTDDGLGHPVMGLLGYDVLKQYCIQMDFAAGKLRFLDDERADKTTWGRAFPMVALNDKDSRPALRGNLFGEQEPHSLIDSGYPTDGWLMPKPFEQWTNRAVPAAGGEARSPDGRFGGETYPLVTLRRENVESDGLGLRFLARHLVTLDYPKHTLYLQRQSIGPLPDIRLKTMQLEALEPLIRFVVLEDLVSARSELVKIQQGSTNDLEKSVAQKLVATLEDNPKPVPADVPLEMASLPLGDAHPEQAEVGWLKPVANRIPQNGQVESPLLDSGKIYATGLFAHSPSRYVYDLGGKWKTLRGEGGLHTTFQNYASGIVFVIKTDGREVFRSDTIRGSKQVRYDVDVTGVKTLELVVEKASDYNAGNWGLWLDPTLFREKG